MPNALSRFRSIIAPTLLTLAMTTASALDLPIPTGGYDQYWSDTFGVNVKRAGGGFDRNDQLQGVMIASDVIANILHPGEQGTFTIQLSNLTDREISGEATVELVRYELVTVPNEDMFHIGPHKLADAGSTKVSIKIAAKGFQDLTIKPTVPETFGGYGLVLNIPGQDKVFLGGVVRSMVPDAPRDPRFRRLAIDLEDVATISRLGGAPNRIGVSPIGDDGTDKTWAWHYEKAAKKLREYQAAKLPAVIEFGHEVPSVGKIHPLGKARSHLAVKTKAGEYKPWNSVEPGETDGKAYMTNQYSDLAWLPEFDVAVKANIKRLLKEFAWPKGPIIGVDLWNEPWNGASISGWMADDNRYRQIYTAMAEAVEEVRKEDKAEVWLLSCDSSSNTFDKLFPDGKDTFLHRMDISSIHYQNTEPASTVKAWVDRKDKDGKPDPIRVWDTESWVANSDGRVASVMPTNYALGIERAVGIWSNWGRSVLAIKSEFKARTDGEERKGEIIHAWSVAAAVGALQHFIGNRPFDRILWQGLPFAYRFNGYPDQPDGGCITVIGDTEAVFGYGRVPFFTVKSAAEIAAKQGLFDQLVKMPLGSAERAKAEGEWRKRTPFSGVSLTLSEEGGKFQLFDYNGNRIPAVGGKLIVPVDDRGFYLATDGSKGSFEALSEAVTKARLDGMMPVQIVAHDPTAAIGAGAVLRLTVRNMLERPVSGPLTVTAGALVVAAPGTLALGPHEVKTIEVPLSGTADPSNSYALAVSFDAGKDGKALHSEALHCNVIAKRTIKIDGKLDEWQGVLPQTISSDGTVDRSSAEAAWWPDKPFSPTAAQGLATAWMAYDDANFYYAARIVDSTPTQGGIRFANRDDDATFFPETVIPLKYEKDKDGKDQIVGEGEPLTWPKGVPRYSYATWASLPFGDGIDSVQLGFNVVPEGDKPWYAFPKGTFRQFAGYWDTDYEYSLHQVKPSKGGGTEIFRLASPDLPHKHFFDHSPKAPAEGAVNGELKITNDGKVRIVECSIPWTEMPLVKACLDAGTPAKITFRINDSAGVGTLELPRDRSVSRFNAKALKPDWSVHWANEIEFGWDRPKGK